jgi:hypothetical protein
MADGRRGIASLRERSQQAAGFIGTIGATVRDDSLEHRIPSAFLAPQVTDQVVDQPLQAGDLVLEGIDARLKFPVLVTQLSERGRTG